jgi:hypothetical protein
VPRTGLSRTSSAAFAVGACWLAFYASWLAVAPGGAHGLRVFADTAYLVPILAAALASAFAAWRADGDRRRFWVFVALANASWLAGETAWSARELAVGTVPFPWWTDVAFMAVWVFLGLAYVPTLAGARIADRRAQLRNAALALAVAGLLWWWLVLEPLPPAGALASVVAAASPTAALVLLGIALALRRRPVDPRIRGAGFTGVALAVAVCIELVYARSALIEPYVSGHWLELGWQLEAVCFTLGAVLACAEPIASDARARGRGSRRAALRSTPNVLGDRT